MKENDKLEEVRFFLELFDTLEKRGQPLTNNIDIEREASFIFSAILNGFYSVTEFAMDNENKNEYTKIAVKKFKKCHPIIYAGSGVGGLRNTTVHVKHINMDQSDYIAPQGNAVNFNLKKTPKLIQKKNADGGVVLNLTSYFYININEELKRVMEITDNHYHELEKFVANL